MLWRLICVIIPAWETKTHPNAKRRSLKKAKPSGLELNQNAVGLIKEAPKK
jgi:hypothetical protein